MKEIPLTQGKVAIVDDDVFQAIGHLKWYAHFAHGNFYATRHFRRADHARGTLLLHHCVVGFPLHGKEINHKKDSLDNRRHLLEIVTRRQNQQDKKIHRMGRLAGATPQGRKWQAKIQIGKKSKYLGLFPSARQAHQRYLQEVPTIDRGGIENARAN